MEEAKRLRTLSGKLLEMATNEGAELEIQSLPAAFRCLDCGYEGPVERKAACCPTCGSTAIRMTAGREFFVDSLKVE